MTAQEETPMPPKRNFEPKDVWALRQVRAPDISPDGATVAFVVATPDPETDSDATSIWVAPTDATGPARRFSAGRADTSPTWSPDGASLAFISDRGDGPQLFVAPLAGGEPTVLTSAPYGVSSPSWSPDSRQLAYVARTGDWVEPDGRSAQQRSAPTVITDLYNRFDGIGRFDRRRGHVFVVDAEEGEARQLTDGDWRDADPAWSPDGSLLAFTSDRSATRDEVPHADVWVVAPAGGESAPRRLTRGLGTAVGPQFSPDGNLVSYVGHEHEPGNSSRNSHLLVVPVDASAPPRSLSGALDRPVWGLLPAFGRAHAWRDDGSVLFLATTGGTQGIYRVDATADTPSPELVAGGDRQIVALSRAGEALAFVAQWPSTLPEIYCAKPDGSDEHAVTAANDELRAAVQLAPLRRITSRSSDGTVIESYILYPPGFGQGNPAPTVLEIHGGPHSWHPQGAMMPLYQALAAAGYVVVLPNPRGTQGYGEDFAGRCVGDWGGGDFGDLMSVVDHLIDQGVADPEHLYVAGYSYGGFMTSWTVGHTDRFRAACISAPVSNLVSMFGTTDIPFFNEFESGGTPWEQPEYYAAHSPVTYLPQVTTPVQVLHWEGDLRCPIGQGEEVFQGLRKLGKEAVLVRYPGGFHIKRTPSQMEDYVQRHLDWFGEH
jgi:dipeptidyl aminopeptidase/acylaminoacyl peptidase